jgi:hypothetical protein
LGEDQEKNTPFIDPFQRWQSVHFSHPLDASKVMMRRWE